MDPSTKTDDSPKTPARAFSKDSTASSIDCGFESRVITTSEYKGAALALAEAFWEDDVARYFIDTPDTAGWSETQKWKLHLDIMEYVTYAHILKGLVTVAGPDYGCVALWMPPRTHMDDTLTLFRSGLWRLYYKLTREGRVRFFDEFFPLLHDTKSSVLGQRDLDSYYLVYVGTRPQARGMGLARKCIEHCTKIADEKGLPCYLESSNDVNPKIYRKMGFEMTRKIELLRAEKKVVLDIMVREPLCPQEKSQLPAINEPKHDIVSNEPTTDVPRVKVKVTSSPASPLQKATERAIVDKVVLKTSTLAATEQIMRPIGVREVV